MLVQLVFIIILLRTLRFEQVKKFSQGHVISELKLQFRSVRLQSPYFRFALGHVWRPGSTKPTDSAMEGAAE